jgi:hypothetical protein
MKYLTIIFVSFFGSLLLSCQSDDASSIVPSTSQPTTLGGYAPTPHAPIPPSSVVEEELDGARRWTINFSDIDYDLHYLHQRFFSTRDGSFYNIKQLHSSADATSKADLDFLMGRVQSTEGFLLTYPEHAVATQFKPTNLSPRHLDDIAENYPNLLTDAFENSPYAATDVQPYNYAEKKYDFDYYQTGDIFLFKTDRSPVRYGAVRILHSFPSQYTSSRTIEVIVQTSEYTKNVENTRDLNYQRLLSFIYATKNG